MPAEKKFTSVKPKNMSYLVFGKTTINHGIRTKLVLTPTEYIFLDFIVFWFGEGKKKEKISEEILFIYTGIRGFQMIKRITMRCKLKGMLELKEIEGVGKTMYPTEKFTKQFEKQDKFEAFWGLRGKDKTSIHKGNKVKAQAMYKKLLRTMNADDIEKAFLKYRAFVEKTGQMQLHTSTWLNPQWAHYKDDLTVTEKPTAGKEQIIHEIKDEDW